MRLTRLFRATPSTSEPRRRRAPRPDAPRTIVALPDAPGDPATRFDANVDAARERLRRAIPRVVDE